MIVQGNHLYGVRFGSKTQYCLLDVDITSAYHPKHDSFALRRILGALEPLGLVSYLACTSSYTNGLHLYFPFEPALPSWQVGNAVSTALERAGFKLVPGQLELFPNPRPYTPSGKLSLFNAHRLPLQIGSYLLNRDLEPTWSSPQQFVQQWQHCQRHNAIDAETLQRHLNPAKQYVYHVSGGADRFLSDLNTEIDAGWTGYGQTNRLLGRIALRCYVFHHVLHGSDPLEGQALVDEIVATARSLPGYHDWCRHQHEIEQRAAEWARCVENSRYFHYGLHHKLPYETESSGTTAKALSGGESQTQSAWNQQQSDQARDKIRRAIAELQAQQNLPAGITARFRLLTQDYQIGGGSLYRHQDLWHPKHCHEQRHEQCHEQCHEREPELGQQLKQRQIAEPDQELEQSLVLDSELNTEPDSVFNTDRASRSNSLNFAAKDTKARIFEADHQTDCTDCDAESNQVQLDSLWKTPPDPPSLKADNSVVSMGNAHTENYLPSLLEQTGGNSPPSQDLTDFLAHNRKDLGGNSQADLSSAAHQGLNQQDLNHQDLNHPVNKNGEKQSNHPQELDLAQNPPNNQRKLSVKEGVKHIQDILQKIRQQGRAALQTVQSSMQSMMEKEQQQRDRNYQKAHQQRLQKLLDSGDPILIAEARAMQQRDNDRAAYRASGPTQHSQESVQPAPCGSQDDWETQQTEEDFTLEQAEHGNVLTMIAAKLCQLRWLPQRVQDSLIRLFGKRSQTELDDGELVTWLCWLEHQTDGQRCPSPSPTG
jgi:hypothetical protein